MYGEKSSMIVQRLPHACGGVSLHSGDWRCPRTVFPTHVGVFPGDEFMLSKSRRLPHACGGVSTAKDDGDFVVQSSPRMWGCFCFREVIAPCVCVFPTHVGVFPDLARHRPGKERLPHACGGVSCPVVKRDRAGVSSPRMWGCF